MNLVPAQVVFRRRAAVALQGADGWDLPARRSNARKVESATSKKIVLGARHSTIKLHKSAAPGTVPAKVYTVEPTGDVTFVQASFRRRSSIISVPRPSPSRLTRRSGSSSIRTGSTCSTAPPRWRSRRTEIDSRVGPEGTSMAEAAHEDHRHHAPIRSGSASATSCSSRSRPTKASSAGARAACRAARRRSSARSSTIANS